MDDPAVRHDPDGLASAARLAVANGAVVAVLLAGGRARRMGGGDKCVALLGGYTLLDRVIERIRPQVAEIVLNANGDPARFSRFRLPVVADPSAEHAGPLAGLLAGLRHAVGVPGATHVVSVATDTPFFPGNLVARLSESIARSPAQIAIAASRGRVHPVFGLWPVSLADDLGRWLGEGGRKVADWAVRHGFAVAHFDDAAGDPFFNINTPADLAAATRRIEERAA